MNHLPPDTLLAALNWRYAVKQFDPTRKIPAADWSALEQSLVLTPSSLGLQPWKFLIVTDPAVRARLRPAAWNQSQVTDCSHFVVFAVRQDLGADHVERYFARLAEVRQATPESLGSFRQMVTTNLDRARAEARLDRWQSHQLYIALGQFMAGAALLGIDTCPMEGFEPKKFDEFLALEGTGYASVVACAAGYRAAADPYARTPKVRFKSEDVIVRI